jgi:Kef-type K+ transport system membrane component KefB
VAALLGALARRLGQPTVVGQIIAGILFGPSLPGHLTGRLFPRAVLPYISTISQVAVAVFMFTVAYELEWETARSRYRPVLLIAAITLLVPMGLGSGAAMIFRSRFAALDHTHFSHSFVLFMGVAISITALPVLAAITREHGIAATPAGVVATTAAGLMDAAAWVVLAAALVGTTARQTRPWPLTLALITAFSTVMLLAVRPSLRWWLDQPRTIPANSMPLALALTLTAPLLTLIGPRTNGHERGVDKSEYRVQNRDYL